MGFGLVFGQAHPSHFGVGVGHTGNHAGVEGAGGQFFITLQFTGDHFGGHMRLMHRFVRQHGLAHDVADGKNVRHVGAHLNVHVDVAAVGHGHARFISGDFFAIGRAAHRLQHQVVQLRRGGALAFKRHLYALGHGAGGHGFGFQHQVVKARGIHLLPHLHQIAVCALHQTIGHFHHIDARTQSAVDGGHFQTNDAATHHQHALGHFGKLQSTGAVDHPGVIGEKRQMNRLAARRNNAVLETHHLFAAGFVLCCACGFFHLQMISADKTAVAAQHSHLAHFGHAAHAAHQLAHHLVFVCAQHVQVELGFAKVHPQRRHMADLVHHCRHMQQGFRRYAAHVQTDTAQFGIALYHHHFEAQISGAKSGAVAARARAQHQHIAVDIDRAGVAGCWLGVAGNRGGSWCAGGCTGRCNSCSRCSRCSRRALAFEHQHHRALFDLVTQLDFEFLDHTGV